jgi:hypothetical protein
MQFEVGGDDGGSELGIGGCSRAGAPDLGRNVVQLLAVLHISLEQLYDMRHMGKLRWGRHTLSATMGPLVARVSAAMTTPPSKRQPTMVVPVLVAFGSGTPWAWRAALRLWLPKSKPGMVAADRKEGSDEMFFARERGPYI